MFDRSFNTLAGPLAAGICTICTANPGNDFGPPPFTQKKTLTWWAPGLGLRGKNPYKTKKRAIGAQPASEGVNPAEKHREKEQKEICKGLEGSLSSKGQRKRIALQ
jgi:hypothetical protein